MAEGVVDYYTGLLHRGSRHRGSRLVHRGSRHRGNRLLHRGSRHRGNRLLHRGSLGCRTHWPRPPGQANTCCTSRAQRPMPASRGQCALDLLMLAPPVARAVAHTAAAWSLWTQLRTYAVDYTRDALTAFSRQLSEACILSFCRHIIKHTEIYCFTGPLLVSYSQAAQVAAYADFLI